METTSSPHIAIRLATADDRSALIRLAALDSAAAPNGPALVADYDGDVVAAHPLTRGRPIADPFRRTANVSELLALRAGQLSSPSRSRGHGRPRFPSGRRAAAHA